ncbi:hypothetical protein [Alteromonas mediterranea]|uniref:Uncharacterized protein n=1 Tax=Alteromonas mediterranea (strain DSM 17117 / CIP 110805 / LMG 28347 / Deep ecotype) TaxID=1774373 RepID=F2GCC7_ALTMD|nr:hypothetical protein [Alteromonas mediterranea]AEA99083.1 hypothetical protein MADE_1014745 [Alteromonas mediterranea DE]
MTETFKLDIVLGTNWIRIGTEAPGGATHAIEYLIKSLSPSIIEGPHLRDALLIKNVDEED